MSFIEIITTPSGTPVVSNYFYADGKQIDPGQAAYIPDDELAFHLGTKAVREVKADSARERVVNADAAPRPGRKPGKTDEAGEGSK